MMIRIALALLVVASTASALTGRWSPPTTGSAVVSYDLRVTAGDSVVFTATTTDTFYVFSDLTWSVDGVLYRCSVRGVDADDLAGPWSYGSGHWSITGGTDPILYVQIRNMARAGGNATLEWSSDDPGPFEVWLQSSDVRGIVTSDTTVTIPMAAGSTDVIIKDGVSERRANIPE